MDAAIVVYQAFCKKCSYALLSHEGYWVCVKEAKPILPYEEHGFCWEKRR